MKKILRICWLIFLLTIASMGIGFVAPFNSREHYQNRVITTEQLDKKEEDSEEEKAEKD